MRLALLISCLFLSWLCLFFYQYVITIGWAIGAALKEALGDRKGISRYAHAYLPMDECLSRVAVDVSGRPFLVWRAELPSPILGDMETELFLEWFQAFAMGAGITLHVENLNVLNTHHSIERIYKVLARALRDAIAIDEKQATESRQPKVHWAAV